MGDERKVSDEQDSRKCVFRMLNTTFELTLTPPPPVVKLSGPPRARVTRLDLFLRDSKYRFHNSIPRSAQLALIRQAEIRRLAAGWCDDPRADVSNHMDDFAARVRRDNRERIGCVHLSPTAADVAVMVREFLLANGFRGVLSFAGVEGLCYSERCAATVCKPVRPACRVPRSPLLLLKAKPVRKLLEVLFKKDRGAYYTCSPEGCSMGILAREEFGTVQPVMVPLGKSVVCCVSRHREKQFEKYR